MKIALYSRDGRAMSDGRLSRMFGKLEKESFDFYEISGGEDILPETDLVMSVGGDGTFLSASQCVGQSGIPILGVNLGRLGLLSEYSPEEACDALLSGGWYLEDRDCSGLMCREERWPRIRSSVLSHLTRFPCIVLALPCLELM